MMVSAARPPEGAKAPLGAATHTQWGSVGALFAPHGRPKARRPPWGAATHTQWGSVGELFPNVRISASGPRAWRASWSCRRRRCPSASSSRRGAIRTRPPSSTAAASSAMPSSSGAWPRWRPGCATRLALQRGDRVLVASQNCPQFVIACYAILRAGGVVVPVNPMSKAQEVRYYAENSGARIAFVAQELLAHFEPGLFDRIVVHAYAEAVGDSLPTRSRIGCASRCVRSRGPIARAGPACRPPATAPTRGPPRGPRHPALHLGHHRPSQGLHAHPPDGDRVAGGLARLEGPALRDGGARGRTAVPHAGPAERHEHADLPGRHLGDAAALESGRWPPG